MKKKFIFSIFFIISFSFYKLQLGITRIFSPIAQFEEMFDDEQQGVVLNNVVQKACIEINEEGEKISTSTGEG